MASDRSLTCDGTRIKVVQYSTALLSAAIAILGSTPLSSAEPLLPSGAVVSAGAASISTAPGALLVHQSTPRAIIDWSGFSIGAGGVARFENGSGATLNRVTGALPSAIDGTLSATGSVYLLNPHGVLVGPTGRVDVGGAFVASTRDVSNDAFLAGGDLRLSGASDQAVINAGAIESGGDTVLIAQTVRNDGTIRAGGTAALASGGTVLLRAGGGGGRVSVELPSPAGTGAVINTGAIEAAAAELRAVGGNVYALAGNRSGVIRATTAENRGGRVWLSAQGGDVTITGTIDASGSAGAGGTVIATADTVAVEAGATIDASGAGDGGAVFLGGDVLGGAEPAKSRAPEAITHAGRVGVAATARIKADGGNGGAAGKGGTVVLWSNDLTDFQGTISARGSDAGGDGGFVETSSARTLLVDGIADAGAKAGRAGEWLLDPTNVQIVSAASSGLASAGPTLFSPSNVTVSRINVTSLQTALDTQSNVTVQTNSGNGSQALGDITVFVALTKSSGTATTLTLNAENDIYVKAPISSTAPGGPLSLVLNADTNADGSGGIVVQSNIATNGGSLAFNGVTWLAGTGALSLSTSGGAVSFANAVTLGNAAGVTIDTAGGAVTFASTIESGNAFSYDATARTWSAANTAATSGSGLNLGDTYLANVTSRAENSRLYAELVTTTGGSAGQVTGWLGGYADANLVWTWRGGPEANDTGGAAPAFFQTASHPGPAVGYSGFTFWATGEPNNAGAGEPALATFFSTGQHRWNDWAVTNTPGSVIETNLAGTNLTINAGAGAVRFQGAIGGNKVIGNWQAGNRRPLGALTVNSTAQARFDASVGSVITEGAITINAPARFDGALTATTRNSGAAITLAGAFDAGTASATSLTLRAGGDVLMQAGSRILGFTATPLAVSLNSGTAGSGAIGLTGAVITSNGGSVTLAGGAPATFPTNPSTGTAATAGVGIALAATTINAGSGAVTLRGQGAAGGAGIALSGASQISAGSALLEGTAGTGAAGVALSGSSRITTTGDATVLAQQGDLTIAGSSLISAGATAVLSTTANFQNTSSQGASAISAGTRWLLYDADPALSSYGGVSAGNLYGRTYLANPPASITGGNARIHAITPTLTLRANNATRLYGAADPAFSYGYISGLTGGDTLASAVTGTASFTGPAANVGVGSYSLVLGTGTLASPIGYSLVLQQGTMSVSPAPLLITPGAQSKLYGAALPVLNPALASYAGLVNGDTASVVSGLTLATTATAASPVGGYAITGSGAGAANYTISYAPGAFTIAPAPLLITPGAQSKLYGAALPVLNPALASYAGLVNGDTASVVSGLTLATTATAASPVGGYAITGSGAGAANYTISYAPGAFTIAPAPLMITADDKTRAYGQANPTLTASYAGLVNGDTASVVSGLTLATTATAASPVGGYAITGSGASAANYAITYLPGTLTVNGTALLIITVDDLSRTYGSANPGLTVSYAGFVNGDTPSAISGLTLTTSANAASPVGGYAITASGATSGSYTIVYVPGTLLVTPAPLTIAPRDQSRLYGAPNPAPVVDFAGFVNGDTPSVVSGLLVSSSATTGSLPGSYRITASGASAANYAIAYRDGALRVLAPEVATGTGPYVWVPPLLPIAVAAPTLNSIERSLALTNFGSRIETGALIGPARDAISGLRLDLRALPSIADTAVASTGSAPSGSVDVALATTDAGRFKVVYEARRDGLVIVDRRISGRLPLAAASSFDLLTGASANGLIAEHVSASSGLARGAE